MSNTFFKLGLACLIGFANTAPVVQAQHRGRSGHGGHHHGGHHHGGRHPGGHHPGGHFHGGHFHHGHGYGGFHHGLAAPLQLHVPPSTPPAQDCPAPAQPQPAYQNQDYYQNASYQKPAPRQYYTAWQYDASRSCYFCKYVYKPSAASAEYRYHEVIYFDGDPHHYYYFNPYKRIFWGRAPVHQSETPRYSLLANQDKREYLQHIPASAFPPAGPMPAIPESSDGVAMTPAPGGSRLTPKVLSSVLGDWQATGQDSSGRQQKIEMSIKPDGTATMTQTTEGQLPAPMYCRYNFDDESLHMQGDYGQFALKVTAASKDQLVLALNNQNVTFQRP